VRRMPAANLKGKTLGVLKVMWRDFAPKN